MGKKKRSQPDLEEILSRPWCYYCERDFDDLKILINHQKAKHFKCDRCGRRLNTAGGESKSGMRLSSNDLSGLSVHMTQVHKESLTTIENALPNRAGLEVEIFGMEGIPEDVVIAHRQRVATQFVQAGNQPINHNANSAAGGGGANPAKKPKLEGGSDLKARLAAHKAKKAAEEAAAANGGSPAAESPIAAPPPSQAQPFLGPGPGFVSSISISKAFADSTQTPPQFNPPFSSPPGVAGPMPMAPGPGYNGISPLPYAHQPTPFQAPTYGTPPLPFGQQPFQPPPFQGSPYGAPSQYPPGSVNGIPQSFVANTPPPTSILQAPRPSSLPAAPGLPQRPAFGAPPVNAFQLQQMHQGHVPAQLPHADLAKSLNGTLPANNFAPQSAAQQPLPMPQQVPQSQITLPAQVPATQIIEQTTKDDIKAAEKPAEKKSKKDKDKDVKLVYSDNDISPEEKLAKLARYAFDPSQREVAAIGAVIA